jgi:prepilin-type N-terminal cleavage/methylation domain-containing protein
MQTKKRGRRSVRKTSLNPIGGASMFTRRTNRHHLERGMTMIELLIAMVVLSIGLGGVIILVSGAIAGNARNRFDTTSTTLSEMVLERIAAAGPNSTGTITITDCANNSLTINTAGSDAGTGATVNTSTGNISFSGTAPSGYGMNYVVCRRDNSQPTYDIRWNVVTHSSAGVVYSKTITVSARQSNAGTSLALFAPPVTLRTQVTN